jgi:hypothetical protein
MLTASKSSPEDDIHLI